jgi:hypothetical protein
MFDFVKPQGIMDDDTMEHVQNKLGGVFVIQVFYRIDVA